VVAQHRFATDEVRLSNVGEALETRFRRCIDRPVLARQK
jgi:hypothetical protein